MFPPYALACIGTQRNNLESPTNTSKAKFRSRKLVGYLRKGQCETGKKEGTVANGANLMAVWDVFCPAGAIEFSPGLNGAKMSLFWIFLRSQGTG
jgi:hypothetical protein